MMEWMMFGFAGLALLALGMNQLTMYWWKKTIDDMGKFSNRYMDIINELSAIIAQRPDDTGSVPLVIKGLDTGQKDGDDET